MGPKAIYHLKSPRKGTKEYLIPEYDSLDGGMVIAMQLPGGQIERLSLDEIRPYTVKVEELPYDMRKWPANILRLWIKHSAMIGQKRLGNVPNTLTRTTISAKLNDAALEDGAEYAHKKLATMFGRKPMEWKELLGLQPTPKKLLSRRAKQNILRKKYLSQQKKKNKLASAYAMPVGLVDDNSFLGRLKKNKPEYDLSNKAIWPKELYQNRWSAAENLGGYMVVRNVHNENGLTFKDWYNGEGKNIDAPIAILLSKWMGIEKADLRVSSARVMIKSPVTDMTAVYDVEYLRDPRITDEARAPKPACWPLTYRGRLQTKEEVRALSGDYPPLNQGQKYSDFQNWFHRKERGPVKCKAHRKALSANCRRCADLVYKEWMKGVD